MKELALQSGEACDRHAVPLNKIEQAQFLTMLNDWELVYQDDIAQLCKVYSLRDYVSALALVQRIGALAEQYDHHPAMLIEWGKVEVRWWTHRVHGLHKNDFILAAKTDELILLSDC